MAVRAFTDDPQALLSEIKRSIAEGRVTLWRIDQDGDLTLTSDSYTNKAWMRPKVLPDRLTFNIIGSNEGDMSKRIYAVFHGRLIQMLLISFDSYFKTASATALATSGDQI